MTLLILGLILWWAAHLFQRVAPDARASMGSNGRAVVAGVVLVGVVLMVLGYRSADFVPVYAPFAGAGHLNNTLMLIAVFLTGVGGTKGLLYPVLRNPMLWAVVIWAIAHLIVNGDQASLVLFGGIGLWAVVQMIMVNRTGPWVRPSNGRGIKGDAMNIVGTLVLFGLVAMIHKWLGHPVFEGNYF